MGLDMYLQKKTYIGAMYDHRKVGGHVKITVNSKILPIEFNRITFIEEEVGYWRKVNHIHRWFVENVQDDDDNCHEYECSREQLGELLDICRKVDTDHSQAETLLPTVDGFFFGGTEYDEYYFGSIKDTINILEKALEDIQCHIFTYQASW